MNRNVVEMLVAAGWDRKSTPTVQIVGSAIGKMINKEEVSELTHCVIVTNTEKITLKPGLWIATGDDEVVIEDATCSTKIRAQGFDKKFDQNWLYDGAGAGYIKSAYLKKSIEATENKRKFKEECDRMQKYLDGIGEVELVWYGCADLDIKGRRSMAPQLYDLNTKMLETEKVVKIIRSALKEYKGTKLYSYLKSQGHGWITDRCDIKELVMEARK